MSFQDSYGDRNGGGRNSSSSTTRIGGGVTGTGSGQKTVSRAGGWGQQPQQQQQQQNHHHHQQQHSSSSSSSSYYNPQAAAAAAVATRPVFEFETPPQEDDSSVQLQLANQSNFNAVLISERNRDIKKIESSVLEVNEIFRDLSHLVVEQGQMIDNIESNVEESVDYTNQGVVEVVKANEYQKSARTKMCFVLLFFVVIVAVVAIVVKVLIAK